MNSEQRTINKLYEEIEKLQDMDKILRNENINLKLRINKALELIYVNAYDTEREECVDDLWGNIEELVDILKGSDK